METGVKSYIFQHSHAAQPVSVAASQTLLQVSRDYLAVEGCISCNHQWKMFAHLGYKHDAGLATELLLQMVQTYLIRYFGGLEVPFARDLTLSGLACGEVPSTNNRIAE